MIEICCGSYADGMAAFRGGAKRIELNSALALGGLTPSVSSLKMLKEETDLKIICMVRPRAAGFCYDEDEFKQMIKEAGDLLSAGADGIAFGFLKKNATISVLQTQEMIDNIKSYGENKEVVFHRAFDCTADPMTSLEILCDLGVDRVLTSGCKPTAIEGADLIRQLSLLYADKIEILAGSGINYKNAKDLMNKCGVTQVHSSCKAWKCDPTTIGKNVTYAYAEGEHESDFDEVSEELVRALVKACEE